MSSKPARASQMDSARVKLMTPWKPSVRSTRSSSARQRTDLLATRTGLPFARRTRSAALASKASRSTIASGASRWAVARSYRARSAEGVVVTMGEDCHSTRTDR